jgi:transposase-like protein
MAATPKSAWGWVRALLHSVYDQPDGDSVHAQLDRVPEAARLPPRRDLSIDPELNLISHGQVLG